MAMHTEPKNIRDVLLYEAPNGYSRSTMTLKAVELGAVVNAAGDLINPAGAAGEKKPVGVVVAKNTIVDVHALVLKRGLVFSPEATDEHKQAAIAELKKLGIKIR
ncbi:head decoration protein [Zooshikella sp. RANM57]|uniref:head decoration protein n=1 Tax=Zooshikella sp. RANM57 TaxID=3425863 RepID=UPI003D6E68D7